MKSKLNEEFVYKSVLNGDLEILSDGTIWRLRKRGWDRWKKRAVSRPSKRVRAEHNSREYFQIRAMFNGQRVCALAHRLVWRHFNGPIPQGLTVNHKDGNKKNNQPENLELATSSEQTLHMIRVLKIGHACNQSGERNSMHKVTDQEVGQIRERRGKGEKLASIASDFQITFQHVSRLALGKSRVVG